MGEMVERVARALCALRGADTAVEADSMTYDMDNKLVPYWTLFVSDARAAITAMREPDGAMKDAGAETYGVGNAYIGPGADLLTGQPTKAYQAMINAALKD
jgi:hypothetical protein